MIFFWNDVIVPILYFFSPGHTHVRNFALLLFKIADGVESCLLLFTIVNQLDRLVTFAIGGLRSYIKKKKKKKKKRTQKLKFSKSGK